MPGCRHRHSILSVSHPDTASADVPSDGDVFQWEAATELWRPVALPSPHHATFIEHTDTPAAYTGQGLKRLRVNTGATALEFADLVDADIPAAIARDTEVANAFTAHIAAADPHTPYAKLAGRAGGQTLIGGTGSGDDLILSSTSHGTKGDVKISDKLILDYNEIWDAWNGKRISFAFGGATYIQGNLSVTGYWQGTLALSPVFVWESALAIRTSSVQLKQGDTTGWAGRYTMAFGPADSSPDILIWRRAANTLSVEIARLLIGANDVPATDALLELRSTVGALLVPRMTTAQRNALTPIDGMIIYNSTTGALEGYQSAAWAAL